jgi:hypothetical protein
MHFACFTLYRQTVTPAAAKAGAAASGSISTAVQWELPSESCTGVLEVLSEYSLLENLGMNLQLTGHRLKPDEMPSDPEVLVGLLQRHMPFEVHIQHCMYKQLCHCV